MEHRTKTYGKVDVPFPSFLTLGQDADHYNRGTLLPTREPPAPISWSGCTPIVGVDVVMRRVTLTSARNRTPVAHPASLLFELPRLRLTSATAAYIAFGRAFHFLEHTVQITYHYTVYLRVLLQTMFSSGNINLGVVD
jgi:hypothetical protein